jgi:hypothetical protein
MVSSAQTVHLSCVKVSTISKRIESRFHLSLITMEYHWVRPKRFLSLSYVWHKLCTYLAPTLTLSPNGSKRDSTRPKSARSYIRVHPKRLLSLWYVRRKACTYLASRLQLSPYGLNRASTQALSPRSTLMGIQNDSEPVVRLVQTVHLSCTDTNTFSKQTKTRFHVPTSPRTSISCI